MANKLTWEEALNSATTILTTELNALADSALAAVSAEVDNTSNLDTHFWLILDTGTLQDAAVAGQTVDIYMIKNVISTTYEEAPVTGGANSSDQSVDSFEYKAATTARHFVHGPFVMNPCKMKFYLDNRCGGQFAATGNTLKIASQTIEAQ